MQPSHLATSECPLHRALWGEAQTRQCPTALHAPSAKTVALPATCSLRRGIPVCALVRDGSTWTAATAFQRAHVFLPTPVPQGIPVRALVRDGVKAAGMLPAAGQGGGVEIVEGDV